MSGTDPAAQGDRPLFRREALAHVGHRGLGHVFLPHSRFHSAISAFFVLLVLGIAAFFCIGTVSRKTGVAGALVPVHGLTRVTAPSAMTVAKVHVVHGQAVERGDAIVTLTSERGLPDGEATQAIAKLVRERRESLAAEHERVHEQSIRRSETVRARLDNLEREAERIDEQLALQRHRVELADTALARHVELQQASFLPPAQVQEKQAARIEQQQRLLDLERAKNNAAREIRSAQGELREIALQAAREQSAARRAMAGLEQALVENQARGETVLRAPQAGRVGSAAVQSGMTVGAGQLLATLLPADGELEAELHAPSRAAGFVKPGMRVQLRYPSFPFQKFGHQTGIVVEVAEVAEVTGVAGVAGAAMPPAPGATGEGLYRVRVKLPSQGIAAYGRQEPLKPGMAVEASIVAESRRLYEWVLEPLYTAMGQAGE